MKIFADEFLRVRAWIHGRAAAKSRAGSFHAQLTFHRVGRLSNPRPRCSIRGGRVDACIQPSTCTHAHALHTRRDETQFFISADSITCQVGREIFPRLCVIAQAKSNGGRISPGDRRLLVARC